MSTDHAIPMTAVKPQAMVEAAAEALDCMRVLAKSGENLVSEVLGGQAFVEWQHYPDADVYDAEFASQYYFHAHPTEQGERMDYGHFHTFVRGSDMGSIFHLVGISMTREGLPVRLFTTNKWVTGETWRSAEDIIRLLDRFTIDLSRPSWPLNRWLTAMLVLFRRDIEELIHERDNRIECWRRNYPGRDAFEDRGLEITSSCVISLEARIKSLDR